LKIICQIVGHQRSVRRAKFDFDAQRFRSVCKYCEAAMIRNADGTWHLVEELKQTRDVADNA